MANIRKQFTPLPIANSSTVPSSDSPKIHRRSSSLPVDFSHGTLRIHVRECRGLLVLILLCWMVLQAQWMGEVQSKIDKQMMIVEKAEQELARRDRQLLSVSSASIAVTAISTAFRTPTPTPTPTPAPTPTPTRAKKLEILGK